MNSHPFTLWLIFCLLSTSHLLSGQEYHVNIQHYGIEEGLSHNQIQSTFRDSRGMTWLLAQDQLNRFDGRDFTPMPDTESKYTVLGSILFEDSQGDLWIRKDLFPNDLFFFNIHTEAVTTPAEKFAGSPLAEWKKFGGIAKGVDGIDFVGADGQFFTFESDKLLLIGQLPIGFFYESLGKTADGNRWWAVATSDRTRRLCLMTPDGELIHDEEVGDVQLPQTVLSDGSLTYVKTDSLHIISPSGHSTAVLLPALAQKANRDHYQFTHNQLLLDPIRNWFWYQGKNHLLVFDLQGNLVHDFLSEHPFLRIANSYQLQLTPTGEVWLSSIEGIYSLRLVKQKFKRHLWQNPDQVSSTDLISCRGIAEDRAGRIYTGGNSRLYRISEESVTEVDRLRAYGYTTQIRDTEGPIWAAAPDTLIQVRANGQLSRWPIGKGAVHAVFLDGDKLWLGIKGNPQHKLACFNTQSKTLSSLSIPESDNWPTSLTIQSIHRADEGRLWLATNSGLYLFQEETGAFTRYWTGGQGEYYLPTDDLKHLYQDPDGIIWLATRKGLIKWDKAQRQVHQFTTLEGLSHNNLYAVYEDNFGCLWLSSDFGIIQFHKASEKVHAYLFNAGISHNEFNWSSHFQATNGQLYFGGLNGITSFHPQDFQNAFDQEWENTLLITDCKISSTSFGEERDLRGKINAQEKIIFRPDDRLLYLRFTLLEYQNNALVKYAYYIEGFTEEWQTTNNNELLISGLPYGEYVLRIKGRTGNGPFSTQELSIPLVVKRPWYSTLFVRLVSALSILFAFAAYFHLRNRRLTVTNRLLEEKVAERTQLIDQQKEKLKELDESKNRFFANISQELRAPITSIQEPMQAVLVQEKISDQARKLLRKAQESTQQLLLVTEKILALSNLEPTTLKDEPSSLMHFTELPTATTPHEAPEIDWLKVVEVALLSKLDNPDFKLEQLAQQLHMSKSSLYRRIKQHTGMSSNQYLREIRLQAARRLLEQQVHGSVREVATQVGFTKASYFTKRYRERFGRSPSSYFK